MKLTNPLGLGLVYRKLFSIILDLNRTFVGSYKMSFGLPRSENRKQKTQRNPERAGWGLREDAGGEVEELIQLRTSQQRHVG